MLSFPNTARTANQLRTIRLYQEGMSHFSRTYIYS